MQDTQKALEALLPLVQEGTVKIEELAGDLRRYGGLLAEAGFAAADHVRKNSRQFWKSEQGRAVALVGAGLAVGAALVLLVKGIGFHVRRNGKYGPVYTFNVPTPSHRWMRVMVVGDVCQSATYHGKHCNELPFEYFRAFDKMFDTGLPINQVLMIGGGGFSYPKHLLSGNPQVSLDVVEADRQSIELALDYFYLDALLESCGERLRIFEDEGLSYLLSGGKRYDAIINDAFAGATPDAQLASVEALRVVRARLNPGGLYMANIVGYPAQGNYADLSAASLAAEEVFEYVWIIPSSDQEFSEEENYLLVASDARYSFPEAINVRPV